MRYDDVPVPSQVVIDLLTRADELAVAATAAIVSGDHDRLARVLDDRDVVIGAVVSVWRDAAAHRHTSAQVARMTEATHATMAAAQRTHATAVIARDQVVVDLAALDARQHASQEYHPGPAQHSIDVVL